MSATDGLYIGLMSGTSLDGIDAALVMIANGQTRLKANHHRPYPDSLRQQLSQLCHAESPVLATLLHLDVVLAEEMGNAVNTLLQQNHIEAREVIAIGSHGQTIRHLPDHDRPNTLQIADPNRIAQLTGITTIADFRRRDMAAGGQGAPLVPAFHQALFQADEESRVAVNIGGISNITLLPSAGSQQKVIGFDTGPGNCLMDYWSQQHQQRNYDENGQWAAQGNVIEPLLKAMQSDAYFSKPAPKSSGREYFNPDWLNNFLKEFPAAATEDVQATLCQLTAWCIADAIKQLATDISELILCGGGAHNQTLVAMLEDNLGQACTVVSSEQYGVHPDWVEAMAFAWLAYRHEAGLPGNLPEVTGASEAVILGGRYPA
jgi:anhydro-N-acetylmuramic acid kinase